MILGPTAAIRHLAGVNQPIGTNSMIKLLTVPSDSGSLAPIAVAAASARYGMSEVISATSVIYLALAVLLFWGIRTFMQAKAGPMGQAR